MHEVVYWDPDERFIYADTGKTNSKMHNVRQFYNGHQYDSGFEAKYAMRLDYLLKAGEIKSWIPHKLLDLFVSGHRIGTYRIDFVVTHNDGSLEYVEVKGMESAYWRQKWKIFEIDYNARFPDAKLTVVKQRKKSYRRKRRGFKKH